MLLENRGNGEIQREIETQLKLRVFNCPVIWKIMYFTCWPKSDKILINANQIINNYQTFQSMSSFKTAHFFPVFIEI